MFEKSRNKTVGIALVVLLGAGALGGCSEQSTESTPATIRPTPTSLVPPVAQPGEVFSCVINTRLKTLPEAGVAGAANVLRTYFHESKTKFLANALYGLSVCERSLNAEIAETEGFVVKVPDEPNYTCITWTAVYGDQAEARIGGLTNHIGLICVPKPAEAPSVSDTN